MRDFKVGFDVKIMVTHKSQVNSETLNLLIYKVLTEKVECSNLATPTNGSAGWGLPRPHMNAMPWEQRVAFRPAFSGIKPRRRWVCLSISQTGNPVTPTEYGVRVGDHDRHGERSAK